MYSTDRAFENRGMLTQTERRKSITEVLASVGTALRTQASTLANGTFVPMEFLEDIEPDTAANEGPAEGTSSPAQHQENPDLLGVGCQSYESFSGSRLSLGTEIEATSSSDQECTDDKFVSEDTGSYVNIGRRPEEDKRAGNTAAPQRLPRKQPSAIPATAHSFMAKPWEGLQEWGATWMGNNGVPTGCTTEAIWPEVDKA